MSLLTSLLSGGVKAIKRDEFIVLNLSQIMTVNNNVAVVLAPFEFDVVVDGTLAGYNDTDFEFTAPEDAIYSMQASYRTSGAESGAPVGIRCAEIIVDGSSVVTGTIAEIKVINPGATNVYGLNSIVFLTAGQKVKFGMRQTSGGSLDYAVLGSYAFIFKNGNVI